MSSQRKIYNLWTDSSGILYAIDCDKFVVRDMDIFTIGKRPCPDILAGYLDIASRKNNSIVHNRKEYVPVRKYDGVYELQPII